MIRSFIFLLSMISYAGSQQTFQSTIFDLPAQIGGEPIGVAAQSQSSPLFVHTDVANPVSAPEVTTQAPFTLPTFTLPSHVPFTLMSHPTLAAFTLPTHQPFVVPTTTAPAQPSYIYYNGYPQQGFNGYYPQSQSSQHQYAQQQTQNIHVQNPQQKFISNVNVPGQIEAQSFEAGSQLVQPVKTVQDSVVPVEPSKPFVNSTPTVVDKSTSRDKTHDHLISKPSKQTSVEKPSYEENEDTFGADHRWLWFDGNYNSSECRKSLKGIGSKYQKKFPTYLYKTSKDHESLVEQRITECERKSSSSHWDKVDDLLSKITLTKSEEGECRSGLIQERISCVNLFKFVCQFVAPEYNFKLVPARIIIQEARQAESGAEKCRQVIRLVKQRLETTSQ